MRPRVWYTRTPRGGPCVPDRNSGQQRHVRNHSSGGTNVSTAAVNLSDVLASLSYALDLAEGQTSGHAIRSCLVGMRLAETLGLDAETRSALHYALLSKDAGGSSNAE